MILRTSRRLCAPPPILPASDWILVNSVTGIQWTSGASLITQYASGTVWGGSGGTVGSAFTLLYRNVIIYKGSSLAALSQVEERDYSTTTKAGWFDAAGNWATDGTDCTAKFPVGLPGGSGAHDSSFAIPSPARAARAEFAFTLGADYTGHSTGFNKHMWLYPEEVGRVYVDLHGAGAGPYLLNLNVQSTVNPGALNYAPNIVPNASIERNVAVSLRMDVLGNTSGQADGEVHLWYKLG